METDLLAELIRKKQDILVQLRDLSRRQVALVGAGETVSLLGLLATKQTLIEELTQTDRQLDPFRSQDPEKRRWRTPDGRRICQEAAQSCTSLLAEIMLLEQHSETDMLRRRDMAASRLQGAHSADQARHAYARPASVSRGQLDLSSEG